MANDGGREDAHIADGDQDDAGRTTVLNHINVMTSSGILIFGPFNKRDSENKFGVKSILLWQEYSLCILLISVIVLYINWEEWKKAGEGLS